MGDNFDRVTLKFWHGGDFKNVGNGELVYEGAQGRTFGVDPDELCYFDLIEMAKKCGSKRKVEGVYYLVPNLSLANGLRRVQNDADVVELGQLVVKYRCIDMYVYHGMKLILLTPTEPAETQTHFEPLSQSTKQPKRPKKLQPKRSPQIPVRSSPRNHQPVVQKHQSPVCKDAANSAVMSQQSPPIQNPKSSATKHTHTSKPIPSPAASPTANTETSPAASPTANTETSKHTPLEDPIDDYDWYDTRPDSPIPLNQLIDNFSEEESKSDPSYIPNSEGGEDGYASEFDGYGSDIGEDELEGLKITEDENETIFSSELNLDSDNSDDEYHTAKERVKNWNNELLHIAVQLQKEAARGVLVGSSNQQQDELGPKEGNVSEYEDSEEDINTPPESEGEDGNEKARRRRRAELLIGPDTDFKKFEWKVGQRFAKREHFRQAIRKYAVLQGRNLICTISDSKRQQRLGARCVEGCNFYVYASWESRRAAIVVKKVNRVHTCHRDMKKNRQMKSTWVAEQFLEVFKTRPHWPAKEIAECIKRAYSMIVPTDFAYKVKYAAHKLLHGSMHDHYKKVGGYLAAIQGCSPRTHTECVTVMNKEGSPPIFQRLYTCYEGLQAGWKGGCRKLLCVDACFLKTFLGGQLVSAVGRDSNDQMYPVAWAVVEGENNLSYEWFFTHLRTSLELGDGEGLCIISDQHQAIIGAVKSILPMAEHRHCARHIFAHWHKTYKGDEMKLLFWKIAKAFNQADYDEALEELNQLNPDAATDFKKYQPQLFCRAFLSPAIKSDAITNNMAETFNGFIIKARTKHLIYMLEDIRTSLMKRLVQKRQDMEKSTSVLCPRIQARLDKEKVKAANCTVIPSSEVLFNVQYYLDVLVVDLEARTCTCRQWDLVGIPCCHAVACIFLLNKQAEFFVDPIYTRECYLKAYSGSIPPIVGERHWPKSSWVLQPPPIKVGPGRPRKNRIKDPFEHPTKPGTLSKTGVEMSCSVCHVKGHNKRGCPTKDTSQQNNQEPPSKKPRGRPRKDGLPPQPRVAATVNNQPQNVTAATPTMEPHHSITAQPTILGRGGRPIRGGRGSRGGRTTDAIRGGRGGGRARGRNQVPQGFGVFYGSDGTPMTNVRGRAISLMEPHIIGSQSSQASTVIEPTQ